MSYFNDDNDAVYCEVGYVNDPDNEVVAIFYRKETNGNVVYKAGRGFIDSTRKGNYTENIKIVTETPDVVIVERRKYDEAYSVNKHGYWVYKTKVKTS